MTNAPLEQTSEVEMEQTTPAAEQDFAPVADGGDESVATDDGAVAEREPIDWSNPESVRSVLDNPEFKAVRDLLEEARLNGENTGKQRTETELRRKAASDGEIIRYQQEVLRTKGVELSTDEAAALLPWMDAHWDRARLDHAKGLVGVAKQYFEVGDDPALEAALAGYGDDPEQWDAVAGRMMLTVAEKAGREAVKKHRQDLLALSPADLRKDPVTVALLSKWQEAEDKAEAGATRTREHRAESSGITSSGTAVGGGKSPSNLSEYETLIASGEPVSEGDWTAYLRLRQGAGMR